jgi:CRISPR-associated endonuclease/helicase Cas3
MNNDDFWAKKTITEQTGQMKWLPLKQHLMDTQFVVKMLYKTYLSENQQNMIKNSLITSAIQDLDDVAINLVSFLGAVHDLGKATPAFQVKCSYYGNKDLDDSMLEKLCRSGYLTGNESFPNQRDSPHALAGECILDKFGVDESISGLIGGHHGKPVKYKSTIKEQIKDEEYLENYYVSYNPNIDIYQKWNNAQKDLLMWAVHSSGFENIDDLPKIESIAAQVILEGLLIMGDWIASCDSYFPLFDIDQAQPTNSKRLEEGWLKWFKNYAWQPQVHSNADDYYLRRFGFKPRYFQQRIFNTMDQVHNPGLVIIEAGMGTGKTEAALATAEQLASKMHVNGVFFALPTQATSNSMFSRVESWLKKVADEDYENHSLQLVHGKANLNHDFAELIQKAKINTFDEEDESGVTSNQWFMGSKKAMLDDFVVGTIDQFLLASLKKKHLALRHLGLSKKVIICDEIHSNDTYMNEYMQRSLEWMGQYHVPVILLSATLNAEQRNKMITSYTGNDDYNHNHNVSYPLITYTDGKKVKYIDDFKAEQQSMVHVFQLSEEVLQDKIDDLLSDGGVIGIIVNTVYRAQTLAEQLMHKYGDDVEVIHSAFIASQRAERERQLVNTIGKNGKRPQRKIIIGTQVLEQSLDIDFDCLITDLAPMDLILQRIGRLHRHKIKRPNKLQEAQVYVLGTSDQYEFEEGAEHIYSKYLLMKTQDYLPETIKIPQDIPYLVDDVYSSATDDKYKDAKRKLNTVLRKKKRSAKNYLLNEYDKCNDGLIGWLNDATNSDVDGLAQVRLGADNIEVIVVKDYNKNEYGFVSHNEIVHDINDYQTAKKLAAETLRLPTIFSQNWNVDDVIKELESYTANNFSALKDNFFLKGALIIKLDKNDQFTIPLKREHSNYTLIYSKNMGLSYKKEDANESI